jgi:hypothetical protein
MGIEVLFNGVDQGGRSLDEGMDFLQEGVELGINGFEEEGHDWSEGNVRHFWMTVGNREYLHSKVEVEYGGINSVGKEICNKAIYVDT